MLPQLLQTLGRFRKRRPVTRGYPPQHGIDLGWMSKPFSTTLHDLGVGRVIDKSSQRMEIAPYRHVDDHIVRKQRRGNAFPGLVGLEAPPKPIRGIRELIDPLEITDKIREDG